jgi:hypothetical protein
VKRGVPHKTRDMKYTQMGKKMNESITSKAISIIVLVMDWNLKKRYL